MWTYRKARCERILYAIVCYCMLLCVMLLYDAIYGAHTTDLDAEESEMMLESDARKLVNFLNQLSN